ncbi:unnamed protein product [Clonostachys rosea f. rosea IK726]|uniref:Uncharacterized protein n=1 Tax=Clonostachys rosea f. rosea IK726 TaxID=1349383 RepID=A0ACA9T6C2_BIOOC|nr:unnamed protein product [Clonostachys rosea f. rosea IK726]
MFPLVSILSTALALSSVVNAQCSSGSFDAKVEGSGTYTATVGSKSVYSGSNYLTAIQTALDSMSSGQKLGVLASGSIGASTITITSGKTFYGCGTIAVTNKSGRGAIEVTDASDVSIPYLTMTGSPYFGLRFSGTKNLNLGTIVMDLTAGIGIRFDRDKAANSNVAIGSVTVTGASSHAVETWNIDGLTIDSVVAKNVGECGLLLQKTTNAKVGTVQGDNAGSGTGYATLRFANNNGELNGSHDKTNSGAAEIGSIDLADNGNNAILIENCYNLKIKGGTVDGGGEVRISARSEFPNTSDISITAKISGTTVRESPCADNISWSITGDAKQNIC